MTRQIASIMRTSLAIASGAVATILLVLVFGFSWWLMDDRAKTEEHAHSEIQASMGMLESYLATLFSGIDRIMKTAENVATQRGPEKLRTRKGCERLREITAFLPDSAAFFVYDASGDPLASTAGYPPPPFNAAGRSSFKRLMEGGAEPYIGGALRGKTVRKYIFPSARTARDKNGGIVRVVRLRELSQRICADLNRKRFVTPERIEAVCARLEGLGDAEPRDRLRRSLESFDYAHARERLLRVAAIHDCTIEDEEHG